MILSVAVGSRAKQCCPKPVRKVDKRTVHEKLKDFVKECAFLWDQVFWKLFQSLITYMIVARAVLVMMAKLLNLREYIFFDINLCLFNWLVSINFLFQINQSPKCFVLEDCTTLLLSFSKGFNKFTLSSKNPKYYVLYHYQFISKIQLNFTIINISNDQLKLI